MQGLCSIMVVVELFRPSKLLGRQRKPPPGLYILVTTSIPVEFWSSLFQQYLVH